MRMSVSTIIFYELGNFCYMRLCGVLNQELIPHRYSIVVLLVLVLLPEVSRNSLNSS